MSTTGNDRPTPYRRPAHAPGRRANRPRVVRRVELRDLDADRPIAPRRRTVLDEISAGPNDLVRVETGGQVANVETDGAVMAEPEPAHDRRLLSRRAKPPKQPSLMMNEEFRAYWLSRVTSQSAQNALIYAFLLIVADRAERATFNSLFVICSIIPAIIFGLPAGITVAPSRWYPAVAPSPPTNQV